MNKKGFTFKLEHFKNEILPLDLREQFYVLSELNDRFQNDCWLLLNLLDLNSVSEQILDLCEFCLDLNDHDFVN